MDDKNGFRINAEMEKQIKLRDSLKHYEEQKEINEKKKELEEYIDETVNKILFKTSKKSQVIKVTVKDRNCVYSGLDYCKQEITHRLTDKLSELGYVIKRVRYITQTNSWVEYIEFVITQCDYEPEYSWFTRLLIKTGIIDEY